MTSDPKYLTQQKICKIQVMAVEVPYFIKDGLNDAALKFKMNKADIVRSVLYDFLVSSGFLPEVEDLNNPEDVFAEAIGRPPVLLNSRE